MTTRVIQRGACNGALLVNSLTMLNPDWEGRLFIFRYMYVHVVLIGGIVLYGHFIPEVANDFTIALEIRETG